MTYLRSYEQGWGRIQDADEVDGIACQKALRNGVSQFWGDLVLVFIGSRGRLDGGQKSKSNKIDGGALAIDMTCEYEARE